MSAIIKACLIGNSLRNTGKECDTSMNATAMLIAVPPSLRFTQSNLDDPISWIEPLMHAPKGQRVYPFFGNKAPINTITNNAESDILVTLDDGTQVFLRYGVYNRSFETINGGLCYASALQGLNKSGYNIIEIDQTGQMLIAKDPVVSGSLRGLQTTFMYAPSPILADFKSTPYKNRFQMSFTPVELVQNGEIFTGASALLSLMGLIDSSIIDAGSSTISHLNILVHTTCAEADLLSQFPTLGTDQTMYQVIDQTTGLQVTITGATVVGGHIQLAGTFVSGRKYKVVGSMPSVWYAAGIIGYDAEDGAAFITIP